MRRTLLWNPATERRNPYPFTHDGLEPVRPLMGGSTGTRWRLDALSLSAAIPAETQNAATKHDSFHNGNARLFLPSAARSCRKCESQPAFAHICSCQLHN